MTHTRDYRLSPAFLATTDGWIAHSLLVRDEAVSARRLREHLAAVHARLVDRIGSLVDRGIAPQRREERELRFMLDELIEALHRLADDAGSDSGVVS